MMTPHLAPDAGTAHEDVRDPRAAVVCTITTALLVVLGPAALMFGGLSAMATDSCGPDNCSAALDTSLAWVYGLLTYGSALSLVSLLTTWLLPWKRRWSAARVSAAVLTLLPPVGVVMLVCTLPA
ncbi:hypothetical protein ACGFZR_03700 [Streptomyces sp. NPDC048241]|uniref:hypothetical protein n=1 Tax=Streptomyces sp. NPDC048241 TaxID=3365521 RepID=UPI00371C629E